MRPSRLLALLGIVVGVAGLLLDFWMIVGGLTMVSPDNPVARSWLYTIIYYFTFLTHLGNLGVVLAYLSSLSAGRWLGWFRGTRTRAMLAGLITLIGLFYHFELAPTLHLSGPIIYANFLLHYAAPVLYLIWWGAFGRHGRVRVRDIPVMLVPALIYFLWTMLRGAVVHDYPYGIIDVGLIGYPMVLINALVVFIELTILLVLVVAADRFLPRAKETA